jgi:hypothetical protein
MNISHIYDYVQMVFYKHKLFKYMITSIQNECFICICSISDIFFGQKHSWWINERKQQKVAIFYYHKSNVYYTHVHIHIYAYTLCDYIVEAVNYHITTL